MTKIKTVLIFMVVVVIFLAAGPGCSPEGKSGWATEGVGPVATEPSPHKADSPVVADATSASEVNTFSGREQPSAAGLSKSLPAIPVGPETGLPRVLKLRTFAEGETPQVDLGISGENVKVINEAVTLDPGFYYRAHRTCTDGSHIYVYDDDTGNIIIWNSDFEYIENWDKYSQELKNGQINWMAIDEYNGGLIFTGGEDIIFITKNTIDMRKNSFGINYTWAVSDKLYAICVANMQEPKDTLVSVYDRNMIKIKSIIKNPYFDNFRMQSMISFVHGGVFADKLLFVDLFNCEIVEYEMTSGKTLIIIPESKMLRRIDAGNYDKAIAGKISGEKTPRLNIGIGICEINGGYALLSQMKEYFVISKIVDVNVSKMLYGEYSNENVGNIVEDVKYIKNKYGSFFVMIYSASIYGQGWESVVVAVKDDEVG